MKAILIARVSTEEQREAGNSLPAQLARLERYCSNKGFEILQTCSFDESAYTNQRDEFDLIIDFIIAQKSKVAVCCDKVDRLSRNIFDKRISLLYQKALQDEIELHFVSDGQTITSNISAVEKFQFGISLGLAKYFSDAISDNIKRAREQILRRGEWPGKAPIGYKNVREGDKTNIVVSTYEAGIVKKCFELYGTGAFSMGLLHTKLKDDYGINWSKSFIDIVLKNPFYYGVMMCKEKPYPHRYPPLISQTLFEEVQNLKAGFKKQKFKYAGKPYIYRGLIRCADCSLTITPEKHKGFVYYHCTQYNGKHGGAWLREETITEQFGSFFKRLQMPKEIADQIATTLAEVHKGKMEFQTRQFDELTKEQRMLTKMMDNLYLDKLKGSITDSEHAKFSEKFKDQLLEVELSLARLKDADTNYFINAKYILDLTNRSYDLFVSSEVEEKRQLIKLLLSNVRLNGKNIDYDVQKPFDLMLECSDRQDWCARMDSNHRPTD